MTRIKSLGYSIICIITVLILITACGGKTMDRSALQLQTKSIAADQWKKLSAKKIYFGHMSVGYNIIDGIKNLMKDNQSITLNIQETTDPGNYKSGIFGHSKNGENVKPKTKVDAFVKTMESGLAKHLDIAFFKFCYVDFNKDTDVNDLFNYYKSAMVKLKKAYPNVTFVHVTSPITAEGELNSLKTKIKDLIKTILGRETSKQHFITGNIKRHEFNTLMRKEYDTKYIIDLELFESTNADGTPHKSKKGGIEHYSMVPAFTYDGGHLNEAGKAWVADKMLVRLAEIK